MILWEIRETLTPVFEIRNIYSTVHCGVISIWQVRAGVIPNTAKLSTSYSKSGYKYGEFVNFILLLLYMLKFQVVKYSLA